MEIKSISAPELTQFIFSQPPQSGLFLQTPAWGEFEKALGNKVEYLGLTESGQLVGGVLIIWRKLVGGFIYVYAPCGPQVKEQKYLASFLELLEKYYKNKKVLFLRVEPRFTPDVLPAALGFKKTNDIQPRATVLLNLSLSAEELLAQMHEKTRYNIRLSQRKGLEWRLVGAEGVADFCKLMKVTAQRDGFAAHGASHYSKLLEVFGSKPLDSDLAVRLAEVRWQGKLLASNLLLFAGSVVTYLHGASLGEQRELMPTYFGHWRAIEEAKKLGCKFYDFWGIAPKDGSKSSWAGITRFKLGFGGEQVEYSGTFDYSYSSFLYRLYVGARQLRRSL